MMSKEGIEMIYVYSFGNIRYSRSDRLLQNPKIKEFILRLLIAPTQLCKNYKNSNFADAIIGTTPTTSSIIPFI